VPAELLVTIVDAGPGSGDELRSLRGWFSDADELRGQVRLRGAEPPPGTLGSLADTLVVTTPVVAAVVPVLVSWIRSRHTDVDLKIGRADGTSVEISAQRVRRLHADQLSGEIERLIHALEPGRPEPGRAEPGRAEPGRAEPGRAEPGRAEPVAAPAVDRDLPATRSGAGSAGDRAG
jgi:hypothetical protein